MHAFDERTDRRTDGFTIANTLLHTMQRGKKYHLKLKLKLKADFYSAIKSWDLEALDGGTSQLGSQRKGHL